MTSGSNSGSHIYYLVCFADKTVTKCDNKGIPIPDKWRSAPSGATYTHELIIERKPEPLTLPVAAGGCDEPLPEVAIKFTQEFIKTAREMAAHSDAGKVYASHNNIDGLKLTAQMLVDAERRFTDLVHGLIMRTMDILKK